MLTAYAGDIIDYTKNIKVIDDRDNEDNDHIIDNSNIKVTIVQKKLTMEEYNLIIMEVLQVVEVLLVQKKYRSNYRK